MERSGLRIAAAINTDVIALGNVVLSQGRIRFCALILYFVKKKIFSHFPKNIVDF